MELCIKGLYIETTNGNCHFHQKLMTENIEATHYWGKYTGLMITCDIERNINTE